MGWEVICHGFLQQQQHTIPQPNYHISFSSGPHTSCVLVGLCNVKGLQGTEQVIWLFLYKRGKHFKQRFELWQCILLVLTCLPLGTTWQALFASRTYWLIDWQNWSIFPKEWRTQHKVTETMYWNRCHDFSSFIPNFMVNHDVGVSSKNIQIIKEVPWALMPKAIYNCYSGFQMAIFSWAY